MVTVTSTALGSPGAVPVAVRQVDEIDEIDEEFAALIYSDPDLLRAEFEAIIDAAWTSPPPRDPTPRRNSEPPPDRAIPDPPSVFGGIWPSVVTGVRDRGDRTRSPPTTPVVAVTKGVSVRMTPVPGWLACPVSARSPSSA